VTAQILVTFTSSQLFRNCAQVYSTTPDPDLSNNQSCSMVFRSADVTIIKRASVSGSNISYYLEARNRGPTPQAEGVVISDILPGEVQYLSSRTSQGTCSYDPATRIVTCQLGRLAGGQTAPVRVQILVTSTSLQPITNCAQISSTIPDPDLSNNQSCITLVRGADVIMTKSFSIKRGSANFSYILKATNRGLTPASNVVISDTLPGEVQYLSSSTIQGTCSYDTATRIVTCQLGQLAPGQSVTAGVGVMPTSLQPFTNCAQVSSTPLDVDLSNNQSCITLGADLTITKSAELIGSNISYTLHSTNRGLVPADGVVITDTLPSEVQYVRSSTTQGTCTYDTATRTVTCGLGRLAVGQGVTASIVVARTSSEPITNCAQISSTPPDADLSNNQSCSTLAADLTITKSATIGASNISYNLEARNRGPGPAEGVVISDTLPSDAQFRSFSTAQGRCTYDTATRVVTCALGKLAVGQSVTALIVITSTSTQPITNCAQANSRTPDPDLSNNQSCITLQR
jgi:uncharacterized repeat protein (TIGR01451 family)